MSEFNGVLGFAAVMGLFIGQILLLAPIFDRWESRAKAKEASDPGLASLEAELLVRRLGEAVLKAVHAVVWMSGLLVLPLLILIVLRGAWIVLPAVFALTFIQFWAGSWTSRKLDALKRGILSDLV